MAISGPKDPRNVGYISGQFKDLLAIYQANLDRKLRENQKEHEDFWGKLTAGLGLVQTAKDYRDTYLADKRKDLVQIKDEALPLYQRGKIDRKKGVLGLPGKLKDFIWEPGLETSA